MNTTKILRTGFLFVILFPLTAWAWGRRGHQIVGENAALIVSQEPNADFMRAHSFDFGYYANVPDFIWKRPATYEMEGPQHYMDLEAFDREFKKHPEIKDPLKLSRKEFDAKFPQISQKHGRILWRIRELYAELEKATKALRDYPEPTGKGRQKLQEHWLTVAGVLAHYIGDLSMPLHMDENHDGEMTGQKGIHWYFEEGSVDELYPKIGCEVNKEAGRKWAAFDKKNAKTPLFDLIYGLAQRSHAKAAKLLAMDKKWDRKNLKQNAEAYHPMIREQLVDSTLVLAELYKRNLGWSFDNKKFYFFGSEPAYIAPGEAQATASAAASAKN